MKTETADAINRASAYIGMHLLGILPHDLERTHIDLIKTVNLAQMQTAREIGEAQNAAEPRPDGFKTIRTLCADPLLFQVKEFSDNQPSTSTGSPAS